MIPRLKPYYGQEELSALLRPKGYTIEDFEREFAKTFGAKYAITFSYGRAALFSILQSQGISGKEIILPAYTCVVVADAIVLSGNIPKFVDIVPGHFNMDLDLVEKAITPKTGAIVATSLFGYPIDTERVRDIVEKSGQKILLIQDCAQAFGVERNGGFVCNQGDVALFSLRTNKIISTILGAIATTNDEALYLKLIKFRSQNFAAPTLYSRFGRQLQAWFTYLVFNSYFYNIVNFLDDLHFIDYFTVSYSARKISFPKDIMELVPDSAAELGMVQLEKYNSIIDMRREIAKFYNTRLNNINGLILPPYEEAGTYSYYSLTVHNKEGVRRAMKQRGIQVGEVLEYSVPYMNLYQKYKDREFPNALHRSQTTANLPSHPGLTEKDLSYIADNLEEVMGMDTGI